MKMLRIPLLMMGLLLCSQGFAATAAQTAQQQKMTTCNAEAKTSGKTGDDRKAFMSNCLKAAPAANDAKTLTPQQQKMKDCNATAKTQALTGDARKTFMSTCPRK